MRDIFGRIDDRNYLRADPGPYILVFLIPRIFQQSCGRKMGSRKIFFVSSVSAIELLKIVDWYWRQCPGGSTIAILVIHPMFLATEFF